MSSEPLLAVDKGVGSLSTLLVKEPPRTAVTEADAFAFCRRMARTQYENFTVVSWFLPKHLQPYMFAIYGFCRQVDDLGDEATDDRLALLDRWEEDLERAYHGAPNHPVMVALQATVRKFDIPIEPFKKLITANRLDQQHQTWATYDDLLHYCDHSANPVGRLVLYVFGYRDEERQRLSDATCTALQLTNFWQDVKRDLNKGRIYLPLADMARFGYSAEELKRGVENDAFVRLMAFEVDRARHLFHEGLRLIPSVDGKLRLDLKLFTLGGMKILDAIEREHYHVLERRPHLSKAQKTRLVLGTYLKMKLGLA